MKSSLVVRYSFALMCMVFIAACSSRTTGKSAMQASVPVTAAVAVKKDVPVQISTIGNVEAYSTVSVKTRVEGELLRVYFKDGQEVKKGDLLFVIDPRPFVSSLKQYEANLARDKALLKKAEADVIRSEDLVKNGVASQQEYDHYRADFETLKETVKANEAAVINSKLQREYCYIRSPINGRVGKLFVHQGNMVKANDTMLVTINQTKPVYVAFFLPEQRLLKIRECMAQGSVKVDAIIPQNETKPIAGELTFVNNEVNNTTGTILLRATFPNTDEILWPRQFVRVVITLTVAHDAIVIPAQATQTGQEGLYVFVIKPDSTVEYRPVVLGSSFDQEVIVVQGIQPGERIVTDGMFQLVQGSKVEIKNNLGHWAQNNSDPNDGSNSNL